MRPFLFEEFQTCADVQSVLDCVLDRSLQLNVTDLGNIQLMDWKSGCLEIKAQRGFEPEFLNFFKRVAIDDGSACGRALRSRGAIALDDVMTDEEFSPYRDIAGRAGVRAVVSTPLVSRSGALVGVLSNHFSTVHRPTDLQVQGLKEVAELAANAIIRVRAKQDQDGLVASSLELIQQSYRTLDNAEKLLSRARSTAINRIEAVVSGDRVRWLSATGRSRPSAPRDDTGADRDGALVDQGPTTFHGLSTGTR